jgi:transposase-like protein
MSVRSPREQLAMGSLDALFPDEHACLCFLSEKRFGKIPRCPHCGNETTFLEISIRQLMCVHCRLHVAPTSGTIFFGSRIPLGAWFQCALMMCISRAGISSGFAARFLGVAVDTAWRMICQIRLQMTRFSEDRIFGGVGQRVELDETLIKSVRDEQTMVAQRVSVFGISDGTYVWTTRVANRSRNELQPIIEHRIRKGTTIDTDGFATYSNLGKIGYEHRVANHSAGFWVARDGANTLHIDSYWACLKRTLARTYVCVGTHNLDLYLKEAEVRFNYRHNPIDLFWHIISIHPPYPKREGADDS